jgi:selenocysteine lyase/cysteine desulfurase
MAAIHTRERDLSLAVLERLGAIRGLSLHGIGDPGRVAERVPTFSFSLAGHRPRAVAEHLASRGISVWDGDFYAYELMLALGLSYGGGLVRAGFVHYNTAEELDRLGDALEELAR